MLALFFACVASPSAALAGSSVQHLQTTDKIAPYVPRPGRGRPVVAVVGENAGTVLSDFAIPYGVLSQSGLADVVSVATQPGLLKLGPLQIQPDHTTGEFDARFPQGADYVIVPAVTRNDDAVLLAWVASQAAKGATMVSICNGSLVLARAGVTAGHRATGHWSTHEMRVKKFPATQWVRNARYVADGKVVSSSGVTAALPTSIALIEAIGGAARAREEARRLGVRYWGTKHDSEAFSVTLADYAAGAANSWLRETQSVGVPVADGIDEISLALVAEAYTNTLRNEVHAVGQSQAPVRTRGGLRVVPDMVAGRGRPMDITLTGIDSTPPGEMPDKVLDDIERRYGARTARFVVLDWEFPRSVRE